MGEGRRWRSSWAVFIRVDSFSCVWVAIRQLEKRWGPSGSLVSSATPHQSQRARNRVGRRIGSGRDARYVERRAQISGVDSRWSEVSAPKPTGGLGSSPDGVRWRGVSLAG